MHNSPLQWNPGWCAKSTKFMNGTLPAPLQYAFRKHEDVALPGRWEFTGSVAGPDIRRRYVGESVAHYFKRGAQAPVLYVNL